MRQTTLAQAIEKLALAGERAGMSVEDMIQLLNAGVGVETLLNLIGKLYAFREQTLNSSRWIL